MSAPIMLPVVGGERLFPHWSILKRPYPLYEQRLFAPDTITIEFTYPCLRADDHIYRIVRTRDLRRKYGFRVMP